MLAHYLSAGIKRIVTIRLLIVNVMKCKYSLSYSTGRVYPVTRLLTPETLEAIVIRLFELSLHPHGSTHKSTYQSCVNVGRLLIWNWNERKQILWISYTYSPEEFPDCNYHSYLYRQYNQHNHVHKLAKLHKLNVSSDRSEEAFWMILLRGNQAVQLPLYST